ncbi:hypothetical protein AYM40_09835 [Paraburkholderia phytofirmans OLGA172]|uniref:Uncharacterized protein n=2 Tax=Paraburkholderia phytofirmans TaxID=261302 RepID=A0A160FK74_9BURK|nr:hypothetical protein AYM40_09835 [Paraburkholderia phytofirmans OLGA172]
MGFRTLRYFELQLSKLQSEGLLPGHFIDFFGKQSAGSPFIAAAERIFDHGTGDISLDPAPIVLVSEYGAYVSAWVWVDGDPEQVSLNAAADGSPKKQREDFCEQLGRMQADGLTSQMCIDFFGLQETKHHYIVQARRRHAHARGVVVFDADPMVSESLSGAYVSAWLWVWNRDIGADDSPKTTLQPPRKCCRSPEASSGQVIPDCAHFTDDAAATTRWKSDCVGQFVRR